MEVIKVGIIDDDGSKVTQIMAYLLYGMKDASKQKADRYSNVRFEVLEIPLSAVQIPAHLTTHSAKS